MEAPEKIYLYPSDRAGEEYESEWGAIPWGEDCVEYTRTDAFIEKAKNWLYLQLNEINMEGEDMENFLKDFKTYMKDKL